MAYGSPNSLDEVEEYYKHIRHGKRPKPEEVDDLRKRYIKIGGRSPLLDLTKRQAGGLERLLRREGIDAKVYLGMKHWYPFIAESIQKVLEDGITDLIIIPLAPHYSKISIGGYRDAVEKAVSDSKAILNLRFVESWHLNPLLLKGWKELIQDGLAQFPSNDLLLLFSAHSLPERILKEEDPYRDQLLETSTNLAKMVEMKNWTFAFQSASHTGERWLGPDILEEIEEQKRRGTEQVLIAPIGFVSDHLEILYDIDVEAAGVASKLGLRLKRTKLPNDHPLFLEALGSLVKADLPSVS